MTFLRYTSLFLVVLFIAFAPQLAFAQTQLLNNNTPKASGLELLLDEARKDGSTVIVVRPGEKETAPAMKTMSAENALLVRQRIGEILKSAPSLWPNIQQTINKEGRFGSFWWSLNAIGIALFALFIGYLATRPVTRFLANYFRNRRSTLPEDPALITTADKARVLLVRAVVAVGITVIYLVVSGAVVLAIHLDHPVSQRLMAEIIIAYGVYRLLRYGVSWNLTAYDAPRFRLVNATDEEAKILHRDWWVACLIVVTVVAAIRFIVSTGFNSGNGLFNGNGSLTLQNAQLLYIFGAGFTIAMIIGLTFKNRKIIQKIFIPRSARSGFYVVRARLAKMTPMLVYIFALAMFAMFVYRVATLAPNAGALIAGPFIVGYIALILYGLALITIQALYNRRIRKFEAMAAAEKERHAQEVAEYEKQALDDEEIVAAPTAPSFEYQPLFRGFFESAALIIIVTVALGETGRIWGVPVGQEGNSWAALLDIALAIALGWIAYNAVALYVERKLEEEGGDIEAEMGGDGGGAGASRIATLLPIFRYVMIAIIFAAATMIILSRLGLDIGPIFAGAGVVGIAVGFGAQKLIQDVFSGAFFLLDDAFRKGEYVEIDAVKGTVEKISIRSFQLRHHLGALHTIPFGEIRQLTNYSRDWVLMKLPLRVTYDTDVEKVRKLVKKLGQELLNHPQVGHTFMQPLKSQGVYKMEDSAMIIRVKFMTKPGDQFVTRKVVYESIQDLFAREGIHFAHKEVTVRLADADASELSESEKKAVTAAARSVIDADLEALEAANGGEGGGGDR